MADCQKTFFIKIPVIVSRVVSNNLQRKWSISVPWVFGSLVGM